MKIKRWHAFPFVLVAWFTTTAEMCGPGTSSTGSDIAIQGDGNQVCVAEVTSGEKTEIVQVDCDYYQPNTSEEVGTSQNEPYPYEN